jgi:hypothetical protein
VRLSLRLIGLETNISAHGVYLSVVTTAKTSMRLNDMVVTDLLGICSGIAAIAVFFHGDALSGYLLVLICYLLFTVAHNESKISRLQDRIAAIDKRKSVVIERPTHLVIS